MPVKTAKTKAVMAEVVVQVAVDMLAATVAVVPEATKEALLVIMAQV